jgi:hypothetical protein
LTSGLSSRLLIGAVILAACVLPLVLALFVLRCAHKADADDAALNELLVQELVADEPLLLSRPSLPALEEQPLTPKRCPVVPALSEPRHRSQPVSSLAAGN